MKDRRLSLASSLVASAVRRAERATARAQRVEGEMHDALKAAETDYKSAADATVVAIGNLDDLRDLQKALAR